MMKAILKKALIVCLAVIVGLGTTSAINKIPVQHLTNNQYVLFRNSSHDKLIRSPYDKNAQDSTTIISLPENTQESSNWAGYIVTPTSNTGYTSVSGSWTVPNISVTQQNAVAAQWIGLGGVNSSDLLQMGTIEQIENGQPTAEVFWEKLPDVAQSVLSVPIGSTINVNISPSSSSSLTWNLTFTVTMSSGETQTQTISTTLDSSYAQGIGTSAEWISEDPSNASGQLYPLANMGTVKYQTAMVDGQPINASGNNVEPVAMVSSNKTILISPSTLSTDGQSFTTTSSNSTNSTSNHRKEQFPLPPGGLNQNISSWGWR
jgi:hypothetical protein